MFTSTIRTRPRPGFRPLQWALIVLVVAIAVAILGMFALVQVVDGNAGQADWMRVVTDDALGIWPVFFLLPASLGVASAWSVRRVGSRFVVALVGGLVAITAYLWLLATLGTRG